MESPEIVTTPEITDADRRTYRVVGYTLLGGLWISIAVMCLGLAVAAIQGRNEATQVLPLDQELAKLTAGSPAAVLDLGILLLFATPFAGVLVALFEFIRQRDRPFIAITAALIAILAIGFGVALH